MTSPTVLTLAAQSTQIAYPSVAALAALIAEGCTVPFIARYRKERTGGLDEVQIREVSKALEGAEALEKRRAAILTGLKEQQIQDAELLKQVRTAQDLTALEDLWAPYKPRRRTRAQRAIEAGLTPLADAILAGESGLDAMARRLVHEDFPDAQAAMAGARDILAERLADHARARSFLRERLRAFGRIKSQKKRGAEIDETYKLYLDFEERLGRLKPHQVLAVRRGERAGALSFGLDGDHERWVETIQEKMGPARASREAQAHSDLALAEGYKRLLFPKIEREVLSELEASADAHAIEVFARNIKNLLMQPPLPPQRVLGLDPGLRTGCKVALVDQVGDLLSTTTLYLHDARQQDAPAKLAALIKKHAVTLIAIGNGTGTKEAQECAQLAIEALPQQELRYTVVDEAGASVYSASDIARKEFPELDVSLRGAVSIARRVQDPLAELVKIDPKSIGVGMYQHDVDQAELARTLDAVIEDVVNAVGVDLNTASAPLLAQVSGIGPVLAERIVAHRSAHGRFKTRAQLMKVKGLGKKTFEQCAGFLRIKGGDEPLDETGIHPESYAMARALLKLMGAKTPSVELKKPATDIKKDAATLSTLATEHGAGELTLRDVLDALSAPGRDPRQDLDGPQLRTRALSMSDISPGVRLTGTVRNVVDFGAFVDIGVKQDGLVHVSQMAHTFVRDPHSILSAGDRVEVEVLEIDQKRGRISLTMKL